MAAPSLFGCPVKKGIFKLEGNFVNIKKLYPLSVISFDFRPLGHMLNMVIYVKKEKKSFACFLSQ